MSFHVQTNPARGCWVIPEDTETAVTQRIRSIHRVSPHVETFPDGGCWTISELDTGKTTAWTLPLWDRYQAIASALLAMPMPAEK